MSDVKSVDRHSRRREATRQRLLAAALVVFAREGLANATISQITQEADVGFGTFYLHFATKEELFEAVIHEGFGELAQQMQHTVLEAGTRGDSWREVVHSIVEAYYHFAEAHRPLYLIMFAGRDAGIGLARELQEHFAGMFADWLHHNQDLGLVFTGYVPELAGIGIVAALTRSGIWWMQRQEDGTVNSPSMDDLISTMSQFIIAAIEGPHGNSGE